MLQQLIVSITPITDLSDVSLNKDIINRLYLPLQVLDILYGGLADKDGAMLTPTLLQPYSVGELKLKSTNPLEYPSIDPNYLSDERDIKVFVEGRLRYLQKYHSHKSMFTRIYIHQ